MYKTLWRRGVYGQKTIKCFGLKQAISIMSLFMVSKNHFISSKIIKISFYLVFCKNISNFPRIKNKNINSKVLKKE